VSLRRLPGQAWRALSRPRRTLHEAQTLAHVRRLRRSTEGWRTAAPRRTGSGNVLVVSLADNVYQLELEGVLATALRLEGYRSTVLSVRHARWAGPILRGFGVEEVAYPDEYARPGDEAEARRAVEAFLAEGAPSVQRLKELDFRGAKIGQQAISSLSRWAQRGRMSLLKEPAAQAELERLLRQAAEGVLAAERLVERARPEIALFNEKGYAGFGSVYDVALAHGANVIQFVHAGIHWADALLLKRYTEETRRVHPASLSPESWETVRALPWSDARERELDAEFALRYGSGPKHPDAGLQEGKEIVDADEVRRRLGLDPARKTAVIFSHVLWDANLFYGEDLFEDMEDWLVQSVRAACANPNVNWVVKVHPANRFKSPGSEPSDVTAIRESIGELPPHVKLLMPETEINTYSFFAATDYAITIRGTVGMETPAFGIPTLTAGTGRYSGLGFTNDSATAGEYLEKLGRIEEIPPLSHEETVLGKKHAYGLFRLRPFRFTSYRSEFRDDVSIAHPLVHSLDVTARGRAEVEQAADLREFAEWAQDRSRLDYLAPPG
jgi:hypothetical protein